MTGGTKSIYVPALTPTALFSDSSSIVCEVQRWALEEIQIGDGV